MVTAASFNLEGTLPTLKWIWATMVLVGVAANLVTLREAWVDFRFVKRARRDEAAHLQAWCSLREQIVFMAFQSGVLWVRIWSLLWPDPANPRFATGWATDATVITALQLLLAYNCVLDSRDRRRVIRWLCERPPSAESQIGPTTPLQDISRSV